MCAESFNTKTDSNVEEVKKCGETMFSIKTMAHEKNRTRKIMILY